MRCKACNTLLEDHELKRKDRVSNEFLDLCDECLHESNEAIFQQEEPEYKAYVQTRACVIEGAGCIILVYGQKNHTQLFNRYIQENYRWR
jgi:hypothetical protein